MHPARQQNLFNISYIWLLVPIIPFVAYLILNHSAYSTNILVYVCSISTIIYLIYCYIKGYPLVEISKANFIIIASGFLVLYLAATVTAYYSFQVNAFDFSVFRSLIEYTLHGKFGYSHVVGMYHFGIHTNWILIPIALIYSYFHSPLTLLLIGGASMWLPGVLIFYYLQKHLQINSFIAFLASIVYWVNYFTMLILKGYFYPEFFYISAFLCFLLARSNKQSSLTLLIIITLFFASVKEDFIFYLAPWCIYNICVLKDKRFIYVLIISMSLFLLNNLYIQPYFLIKSKLSFPLYYGYWSIWGDTPKTIIISILTHPFKAFVHILSSSGWKRLYGALLFIPWLSLDMMSFSIIPVIIYSLSNHGTGLNSFHNYYAYLIWPAALIGYMQFIAKLNNPNNHIKYKSLITVILLSVLILSCLWSNNGLPIYQIDRKDYAEFIHLKTQVHKNVTYCVKENIYTHFSDFEYNLFYPLSRIKKHPNCYIIINFNGNNYPYANLAVSNTLQSLKSNNCILNDFSPFYIVDKTNACHKVVIDGLFPQ